MAALNLNSVRQSIEEKLIDELNTAPPIKIVFGNQPFQPIAGTGFVQCLIEFTASTYITLGGTTNSTNSQEGLITLNIFTKIGVGLGNNLTGWAGTLKGDGTSATSKLEVVVKNDNGNVLDQQQKFDIMQGEQKQLDTANDWQTEEHSFEQPNFGLK